jgi:serine/threonine protein kinase/Tol biopolymer transport system component
MLRVPLGSLGETGYALGAEMAVGSSRGDDVEDEAGVDASVTAIGEPALIRATSIEIVRGSILAGRYQIEAVIGKGGSGIVLRAFDRVAQVPVAVKILKPDLATDPRWIERFSRELRLARQIQHPNVCRVFDIGQADGHWFITMELATAGTLRDQLGEKAKQRSSEERITDVRAVVAGLAAIHDAGIVHRDVKPDNYLRMQDGRLVLSDFGLATNPGEAPTVSIMVGTPFYMAPEVVMGEPATQQSDIWAAGVVIHEILLGARPERTTPRRTKIATAAADATIVEKNLLRLSQPCLAEEVTDRPQSGSALQRLVEHAVTKTSRFGFGRASVRPTRHFWGAIAIATLALTAAFSRRLWQPATAGSSSSGSQKIASITTTGTPSDWSIGAKRLARFEERVHCFSVLHGGETAQVVWGSPRRAEDLDLATGERKPSGLAPETFAVACPQVAPNGNRLLFTRHPDGALPQIVLAHPDGSEAKVLTTGTEPVWLPNGEEFLFDVDASHAGVFSIPTMSYNLLNDDRGQDKRLLHNKAVGPRGDLIAVGYHGDSATSRLLEIHSLPDLAVIAKWSLPFSIHDLRFGEHDLFLSDTAGVGSLARLDWRTGHATQLGYVAGQVLHSVSSRPNGTRILLSNREDSDVWIFEPGQKPRQLTDDGNAFGVAWSPTGEVLVGKFLQDGRYVIFLYDRTGHSHQVTDGPSDCVPSFSADGSAWLYADYDKKAIVRCENGKCLTFITDPQVPEWPVFAPDGQHVAYTTFHGEPRLRIVSADGKERRDLGPTAPECPPVWTNSRSVWAFSGAGNQREWDEIDIATAMRTGRSKPATTFNPDKQTCGWENEPVTSPFYRHARVVHREAWEIATQTAASLD